MAPLWESKECVGGVLVYVCDRTGQWYWSTWKRAVWDGDQGAAFKVVGDFEGVEDGSMNQSCAELVLVHFDPYRIPRGLEPRVRYYKHPTLIDSYL